MGKSKKRYLTRRILAMMLAVAMTVTMVPSTALAAPAGDDAEEGIVNVVAEESGDVNAPEDKGELKDTADADVADDATADENKGEGADDAAIPEDKAGDDTAADGGNTEVNADDTPAAQPAYEIVLDHRFGTEAEYNGSEKFGNILSNVSLKKGSETLSDDEVAKITCAWKQKGADGNYAAITGNPINAGSYQAVLNYPKQDGVHDGAEKTVDCEIKKASVTITLVDQTAKGTMIVTPGTKRKDIAVPVIESVVGGAGELNKENTTLTMEIKNALTGAVIDAETELTKGTDYVMALTPDTADAAKKNNYELKPFTVDIEIVRLIDTQITVTLADKWKQENGSFVITKEYDGNAISDPVAGADKDYTFEVQYRDTDGTYKKLEGAEAVGEWVTYTDCEVDENGKVKAPVNAGTYTYKVVYQGKDGVYAEKSTNIAVEITPMELTVEAANTAPLKVRENITAREVLAQIEYKVLHKAGETVTDVTADVKAKHIWGTSFDNNGRSQIYEPLFTVEESSDGTAWTNIYMDDRLKKDTQYRVTFRGRKAVLYANGNYVSFVNDINSTSDASGDINGVDSNYHTSLVTAEGKELAVEVKAGTKAVIDVSGLLGEKKGAKTIAELQPKQYDGAPIFTAASDYRNQVKLKTEAGETIPTEQREFTYTWKRYKGGYYHDRIDAEVEEKNQTLNVLSNWQNSGPSAQAAGVYRLTISYTDKIDPDTYNYADPVTVYFAIDPRQVEVTPKEDSYEVLEGRSVWDFFHGEKAIEYTVTAKDGGDLPNENRVPFGAIVKETTTPPNKDLIYQDDDYNLVHNYTIPFEKNDNIKYALAGCDIYSYDRDDNVYNPNFNYTCCTSEIVVTEGNAERVDTLHYVPKPITVEKMGEVPVTITVDSTKWVAKEKVYDAKPFDLKDLVPDGLVTVKKADGTVVTDLELKYIVPYTYEEEYLDEKELKYIVDAGTYDLYVRFDGDKNYAPVGWDDTKEYPENLGLKVGTFKITKREIALTADLDETYTAGTDVWDVLEEVYNRYKVTGYVTGQEEAFKNYDGSSAAWGDLSFYVAEKGSATRCYGQLERNKTYEVWYDSDDSTLYDEVGWDSVNKVPINAATDYMVKTNEPVATFKVVPGNSTITSVYYSGIGSVKTQTKNDAADPMKREVTMTEAIKWSSYTLSSAYKNKKLEGNLIALQVTAPTEYNTMPDTAMYQNEIEAKGGYVVDTSWDSFTAVFNAADGDKEIKLRWEDGYVETVTLKFSQAVKLANLNNAVAPKALAFNAPQKKMAVGEEQQLDVKITKEQMGDVIYLGYESSDPKTLVVNQYGFVTALKIGKATVTVFPLHLVNGKAERIKNAKSATLQIQVTKLDAPKKVKATPHGTFVELNYDSPANGYRREIYVVEKTANSPKKASDFDQILKNMKENQWKENGFAIAPVYISLGVENANRTYYNYVEELSGLDIKKDYTIYVRNVCAVRTLDSYPGKPAVTQEAMNASVAGVVVNVKTKKAEVKGLSLDFYDAKALVYDWDGNQKIKFSELKNGTLECRTMGIFPEVLGSTNELLPEGVGIYIPFGKEDKAKYKDVYEEPKLEYALDDCYDKKTDTWGWGTKNDYASIDKKGKIKITGFPDGGYLHVRVRDTVTDTENDRWLGLIIEDADSVKATKSSVTLSVGQEVYLEDMLTYNLGKVKLTAYPIRSIDLEKVRSAIKSQNQEKNFTVDQYGNLTAINGGGTLTLNLTDTNVEKKAGTDKATAKVTIKSKDLDPVKNLKACNVIHDRFGLTFKYTGHATKFLLEVSDAKKPIYSKVINMDDEIQPLLATDKAGRFIQVRDAAGNPVTDYNDDTGKREPRWTLVKDTYEIQDEFIGRVVKLYKESQYTVSLTPIYEANKAKPATAKVKTTKIPAQDWYLNNYQRSDGSWFWGCDRKGGMRIFVSEYGELTSGTYDDYTLDAVSGNTYTLTADVQYNRGRVNDTLIWTVGDSKVASVKAAAGTYCITLKGLKPGNTTLEVRSKIMGNKVIARYNIRVSAVEDAYHYGPRFYGENEPE